MPSQLIPFKVIRRPHESSYSTDVVGVKKPLFYRSYEVYGNLFSYLPYTFRDGYWFGQSMKLAALHDYPRVGVEDFTFYLAEKDEAWSGKVQTLRLADLLFESEAFHLEKSKLAEWIRGTESATIHRLNIADNKESEGILSSRFLITGLAQPKGFVQLKGLLSAENMVYHPSHLLTGLASASSERHLKEVTLAYLQQAIHEASAIAKIERIKEADAKVIYKEVELTSLRNAETSIEEAEEMRMEMDGEKKKKDSSSLEVAPFGDEIQKDAASRNHMTFLEKVDYDMLTVAPKMGDNYQRDGLHDDSTVVGEREGKSTMKQHLKDMISAAREGKTSLVEKWRVLNIIRKTKDGRKDTRRQLAVKQIMDGTRMRDTIFALIHYRDALLEQRVIFSKSKERVAGIGTLDGSLFHHKKFASLNGRDAYLKPALLEMDKAGVTAEFIELLLMDSNLRDAKLVDKLLESDRHPIEAIQYELDLLADKNEKFSIFNRLLQMVKGPKDSGWILQVIEAMHHNSNRNAVIAYLKNSDKRTPEGLLEFLEAAEGRDLEGLSLEGKLAWNKDKPNRPAGLMDVSPLAHWDIGWDDVMEEWKPGWDYMIMPSSDYPYEAKQDELYDKLTGTPYRPLGPANEANVRVETPMTHPFPDWANIGRDETWVEIFTYQDVLINILGIQRENKIKIAGMTTHQALQFVLRELYIILERANVLNKQYQRMFRFVRWYAETITMKSSHTILMREYEDWTDGIMRTGAFDAPHTKTNVVIQSNGLIESIAATGQFAFSHETLIDGTLTFSIANTFVPGSSGNVEFYMDGILMKTYTASGVLRETYDVPAGLHNYEIVFNLGMGEQVKLSGFVATHSIFKQAYTEQVDDTNAKGLKAVDALIQELINYYVKHHLHKTKGAMGAKQRKIWLN